MMDRIEAKIDALTQRVIRIEQKLDDFKYGVSLTLGGAVLVITALAFAV